MVREERVNYILRQINIHNKVLTSQLCIDLNVSEDTIRRDLNELAKEGLILKVHGGALSVSFGSTKNSENIYALESKKTIAQKTLNLIKRNMVILLGGGTTIRTLLKELPHNLEITIYTVSLSSALELLNHPNIEVIFIGGKIDKTTKFSVGGETVKRISEINADMCILGTSAINENWVTEFDHEVTQVKKAMIQASKETIILAISEKLNSVQRLQVCPIKDINYLITELEASSLKFDGYREKGVIVL